MPDLSRVTIYDTLMHLELDTELDSELATCSDCEMVVNLRKCVMEQAVLAWHSNLLHACNAKYSNLVHATPG